MEQIKNKPVQEYKNGGIKISVWANKTKTGTIHYNYKIEKSYKDDKGTWKNTDILTLADLCLLHPLVNKAVGEGLDNNVE